MDTKYYNIYKNTSAIYLSYLTELIFSICLTAAAAAAAACAFLLPTFPMVLPFWGCFRFQLTFPAEFKDPIGPGPDIFGVPVPTFVTPLTFREPLVMILSIATFDVRSVPIDDDGTNTGGAVKVLGSEIIWLISASNCNSLIFATMRKDVKKEYRINGEITLSLLS